MEAPDKLFLLVGEEEIKLHLKRQTQHSLVFWLFVQTLFLLLFAPFIFGDGLWLASLSGLCAFIGGRKISALSSKASKFLLKLDWTGTLSFPKKASASKSCFVSLPSLRRSRNFKQRQASCLSGLYPKGCSEGAWEDLAKSLSSFLSAKWRPLCPQSSSSLTFLAGAGLYRAILDCDSSGSAV